MLVTTVMLIVVMTKGSHWNFSPSFKTTCHDECFQKLITEDDYSTGPTAACSRHTGDGG